MLPQNVQYSQKGLFETFKVVMQKLHVEQQMLPVSATNNTIKCLDFDMDKIVFKSVSRVPLNLAEVNPYNKTWLDVMEMV